MTSTMEFSENFVDLVTITFTIATVLGVFLLTTYYSLDAQTDVRTVRAIQIAESVVSAPCLTEESGGWPARALLIEEKMQAETGRELSCMKIPSVRLEVKAEGMSYLWGSGGTSQAEFPVAIKLVDGKVVPGKLTVWA